MLIVVALGGNALLHRGSALTAENQRENVKIAAKALAQLINAGHSLVITHGNGPQIGLLALQNEAYKPDQSYPLDILGAETDGMIGYLIEQELENVLEKNQQVATLLTQIEVDADDIAFNTPSKPVGPVYNKADADVQAANHGWIMTRDGDYYRRVVASPKPKHIPDVGIIRLLVEHGVIVICAGGGGIPVVRRQDGSLVGIEAVIDKDHSSALLARELKADALLMLTDVDGVYQNWNSQNQSIISQVTAADIRKMDLPVGSMAPKVEAACDFVESTGGIAGIGALSDALKIIEGQTGTVVSKSSIGAVSNIASTI